MWSEQRSSLHKQKILLTLVYYVRVKFLGKNLSSENLKLQIKVPLKELVFAFSKTGNKCRVVDGVKSIRYFYYFSRNCAH